MTQAKRDRDFTPVEPKERQSYHPGGDCTCTNKARRITRIYMGYGYCETCGRLTREKAARIRDDR